MNGSVSSRKTGLFAPSSGRIGRRRNSRMAPDFERAIVNAVAMATADHQSRFRSSSRCSRKLIVGRSASFVRGSGIGGPGRRLPLLCGGGGRQGVASGGGLRPVDLDLERIFQIGRRLAEFGEAFAD